MKIRQILLAGVLVALGGTAKADDIVYFTNGTAMPVRSHKIEKGMIRVDLGSNAVMAFPVSMVEKVETAGKSVFPNGGGVPANQAVAGGAPNTTTSGHASVPAQFRQMRRDDPMEQLAQAQARAKAQANNNGDIHSAPASANTAAKRNLRIVSAAQPSLAEDGSYRRGNVTVLPSPNAPVGPRVGGDETKPMVTSFGPPTDAVTEPDGDANSGDGDDAADPDADDPPDER